MAAHNDSEPVDPEADLQRQILEHPWVGTPVRNGRRYYTVPKKFACVTIEKCPICWKVSQHTLERTLTAKDLSNHGNIYQMCVAKPPDIVHHFHFPDPDAKPKPHKANGSNERNLTCIATGCSSKRKVAGQCVNRSCPRHCAEVATSDQALGLSPTSCPVHQDKIDEAIKRQGQLAELSSYRGSQDANSAATTTRRSHRFVSQDPEHRAPSTSTQASSATRRQAPLAQPMGIPVNSRNDIFYGHSQPSSSPLTSPIANRHSLVTSLTQAQVDYEDRKWRVFCFYWLKTLDDSVSQPGCIIVTVPKHPRDSLRVVDHEVMHQIISRDGQSIIHLLEAYMWSEEIWASFSLDTAHDLIGCKALLFRERGMTDEDCPELKAHINKYKTTPRDDLNDTTPTSSQSPAKRPHDDAPSSPRKARRLNTDFGSKRAGKTSWWMLQPALTVIDGLEKMQRQHADFKHKSWPAVFQDAFPGQEWVQSTWQRHNATWMGLPDAQKTKLKKTYASCSWGKLCDGLKDDSPDNIPSSPVPSPSKAPQSEDPDSMSLVAACQKFGCPKCHTPFPFVVQPHLQEALESLAQTWVVLEPNAKYPFQRDWDDDNGFCTMHQEEAKAEREGFLHDVKTEALRTYVPSNPSVAKQLDESGPNGTLTRGKSLLQAINMIHSRSLGQDSEGSSDSDPIFKPRISTSSKQAARHNSNTSSSPVRQSSPTVKREPGLQPKPSLSIINRHHEPKVKIEHSTQASGSREGQKPAPSGKMDVIELSDDSDDLNVKAQTRVHKQLTHKPTRRPQPQSGTIETIILTDSDE